MGSRVQLGHLLVYMNVYLENNRGEGASSTSASILLTGGIHSAYV